MALRSATLLLQVGNGALLRFVRQPIVSRKRPDWSRRLPRQLVIPDIMTVATLADVRTFMRHVPAERRELSTWRYVADELDAAARGADPRDVEAALLLVLSLERVPCRLGQPARRG